MVIRFWASGLIAAALVVGIVSPTRSASNRGANHPEVSDRDKTGTSQWSQNSRSSQGVASQHVASFNKSLAERTGFEPAVRFDPYTGLANRRFRPLSHLSRWVSVYNARQTNSDG